jgi:molybdopterin-guanine dinucleotide biosynthesis protein A
MSELTIVVQAGGESKRMGSPKALASFCGLPLICRSLNRLDSIADELIITSNDPKILDFLRKNADFDRFRVFPDVYNSRSALNGLYTALHHATSPYVGVVACDMIFPSAPLFLAERDALEESGADAAVPTTDRGWEPFHAVYRRASCLPVIHATLLGGKRRATGWYDQVRLLAFTPDRVQRAAGRTDPFINVNTPEELAALERSILGKDSPASP